jgi:hypothetical protein
MTTLIDKTSAFGSRFNMYRLRFAGYAWNPTLREWEVFVLDEDGTIQDLIDRYRCRSDAVARAEAINAKEMGAGVTSAP